jgi:hypothetical protein
VGIRVGDDKRQWEVGKALVFDESFEHEVWNDNPIGSGEYRHVLLFFMLVIMGYTLHVDSASLKLLLNLNLN